MFKSNRRRHNRILEADLKAAKKLRLRGWAIPWLMAGAFVLCWFFDQFGRLNLVPPFATGCGALGFLLFLKWQLRGYSWFWWTLSVFVAFHVLLLVFVPWTTKWIPAAAYAGAASIDIYGMLWLLSLFQKRAEKTEKAILRRSRMEMNHTSAVHTRPEVDSLRE